MDNLQFFIPFAKRDNDQRIVYGYASSATVDSQGDIISQEGLKKALPDYLKFPTIREMHQASAVGRTKEAQFDEKGLFIKGYIVDPIAWLKVKEGVYNGFSIGGRALKRRGNVVEELALSEISLVDRPANPDAVFALYKFDIPMQKIEAPNWSVDYFAIAQHVL